MFCWPWWIVTHHFCDSFSCYVVSISSLRGVWVSRIFTCYHVCPQTHPPTSPLNHFLSLGPPICSKFAAMMGIRVTECTRRGIKATKLPHRVSAIQINCFNISIVVFMVCSHFRTGQSIVHCLLLCARGLFFSATYLITPVACVSPLCCILQFIRRQYFQSHQLLGLTVIYLLARFTLPPPP